MHKVLILLICLISLNSYAEYCQALVGERGLYIKVTREGLENKDRSKFELVGFSAQMVPNPEYKEMKKKASRRKKIPKERLQMVENSIEGVSFEIESLEVVDDSFVSGYSPGYGEYAGARRSYLAILNIKSSTKPLYTHGGPNYYRYEERVITVCSISLGG